MMIDVLHLLWIIPFSTMVGYMAAAILCAGSDRERR